MTDVWNRIDTELTRRRKNWQWLADKMEWSIQRLQNWKKRGVPVRAYPDLANALGRTIDWLAGLEDGPTELTYSASDARRAPVGRWPFSRIDPTRVSQLPPEAIERIQVYIEATVHAWEATGDDRKSRSR